MLIFSVLWPYVKLLMMMHPPDRLILGAMHHVSGSRYAWVTPMDHGIRGPMLIFLEAASVQKFRNPYCLRWDCEDQIGKWSLMDNIILFLFAGALLDAVQDTWIPAFLESCPADCFLLDFVDG